jgi:hypothetical protein
MVIGSGLLAATSFALAFMGNRPEREADAVPLAEGFVEACLRTGATVERLTAVARAHGRPINTMPDNKIVSWTTTRSGQELRVSYLDLRTERSCSVSATNGQVDRGKFVTALRKVLDETAPVDRAHLDQHPFEQRKHTMAICATIATASRCPKPNRSGQRAEL